MASVSLNIEHQHQAPAGDVLTIDDGQAFISVRFLDGTSIILGGFDTKALTSARQLASTLTELADQLEQRLADRLTTVEAEL